MLPLAAVQAIHDHGWPRSLIDGSWHEQEQASMGETLADLARHDKAHHQRQQLVIGHPGENAPHRAKTVIDRLDFFSGTTQALKQVSFILPEHQVTAPIGPSGCGRSTLLAAGARSSASASPAFPSSWAR